ncbi:MAG: DUF4270 family protein [Chitinophagaceae bacterium]|nr:DUF4270 family protein [Chitinophagaceae bacterium]
MITRIYASRNVCWLVVFCCFSVVACEKKEIQFGSGLPESFTRLLTVDTVTPYLSTIVLDSFPTSGNSVLFIGRTLDPIMGPTTAQTFFQIELPAAAQNADIPDDAVYDSTVLVLHPNNNWYGDTSKSISFTAYEMAEQADYTYATRLWNTSSFNWLPTALSTVTRNFSPSRDSLTLKIRDNKGTELFRKIRDKDPEFQTSDAWLTYFKGITIKSNASDNGAIYSFKTDSSTQMRIHYHTTWPYYEEHTIDFHLTRTEYQFNQLLVNRTGTPLEKKFDGQEEYFPTEVDPVAFSQTGMGVLLKVKFPSLPDVKTLGKTVKLLSAILILKPVEGSFDQYSFPLCTSLYMAQTNATNIIGQDLTNIEGDGTLTANPQIDDVYRLNTNYSFDITHYVDYLLSLNNSAEMGLFVMEQAPGTTTLLNRAVIGTRQHPKYISQLKLTLLTTTE